MTSTVAGPAEAVVMFFTFAVDSNGVVYVIRVPVKGPVVSSLYSSGPCGNNSCSCRSVRLRGSYASPYLRILPNRLRLPELHLVSPSPGISSNAVRSCASCRCSLPEHRTYNTTKSQFCEVEIRLRNSLQKTY